jgi:hypothetical protein
LGPDYGEDTAQRTIANSNYNALETNLRYVGKRSDFLLGYTYSKSIDQGSNLGEQLDPLDFRATRAISAWDMRHNFVASYKVTLPFDLLSNRARNLTEGWSLAGTTRFSTGFPVTLYDSAMASTTICLTHRIIMGRLSISTTTRGMDGQSSTIQRQHSLPKRLDN